MKKLILLFIILSLLGKLSAQDRNPAYQINLPAGAFKNAGGKVLNIKTDFGAKGDGITDDTQAFIAYMNKIADSLRIVGWHTAYTPQYILYIPDGTYLVSNTLVYEGKRIKYDGYNEFDIMNLRMWGQSREKTIIKLKDNSAGYGSGARKPVVAYCKITNYPNNEGSNVAYSMEVRNLTINTGKGNPGAIALRYIGANSGIIQNVLIKSEDGLGYIGLENPSWSVQAYFTDITIDGFDNGIFIGDHGETNPVYEYVTLKNQRVRGVLVNQGGPVFRKLLSLNTVPAIVQQSSNSSIVLLNSRFTGGNNANPAIDLKDRRGKIFVRDLTTNGYGSSVKKYGIIKKATGWVEEYVSDSIYSTFPNQDRFSINLPIEESPIVQWEQDLNQWVCVDEQPGATNVEKFKNACATGKSTLYFKNPNFELTGDINVPPTVNHIFGMFSNISDRNALIVTGNSSTPLLVECLSNYFRLYSKSNRTVILRHCSGGYYNMNTTGQTKVFIESCANNGDANEFCKTGTTTFIRSINCEHIGPEPQMKVYGGKCVTLGYKTERRQTSWKVTNSGVLEVLGGYRNTVDTDENFPLLDIDNANAALIAWTNLGYYSMMTREKRASLIKTVKSAETPLSANNNRFMPLYLGYTIKRNPVQKSVLADSISVEKVLKMDGFMLNTIRPVFYPDTVSEKAVIWSTSNDKVVSVDGGIIQSKSAGTVWIKATSCAQPEISDSTLVTVSYVAVTGIKVSADTLNIDVGYSKQIGIDFIPQNGINRIVKFESLNNEVATVDSLGITKGIRIGKTSVVVTSENGNNKDTCIININPIPVSGVKFNTNEITGWLNDTIQLVANIIPVDATNTSVSWKSENEEIAKVYENGIVVATGLGQTKFSVTTSDGKYSDTCNIQILNKGVLGDLDIGAVCAKGSLQITANTYTLHGGGTDIWDNADGFHYVFRKLDADGVIIAKVSDFTNTNEWAKAGVMFRESIKADSKHASMLVTAKHGTTLQYRPITGNGSYDNTPEDGIKAPHWVKLVRSGNVFSGFKSVNGVIWQSVGSVRINMGNDVYAGLCITSHDNCVKAKAVFDHFIVTTNRDTILDIPNELPLVAINSPTADTTVLVNSSINIKVSATDANDQIVKVEFYVDGALSGTDLVAPYTFLYTPKTAGGKSLTVKAYDTFESVATSPALKIYYQATGIEHSSVLPNVEIYPNPSDGNIIISNVEGKTMVIIKDLNSRIVYQQESIATGDLQIKNITLLSGIYFLTINTEGKIITKKLILNNLGK